MAPAPASAHPVRQEQAMCRCKNSGLPESSLLMHSVPLSSTQSTAKWMNKLVFRDQVMSRLRRSIVSTAATGGRCRAGGCSPPQP